MSGLKIVLPYYENKGMLEKQMATWDSYPADIRKSMTIVVVDDGSQKTPALSVVKKHDYNLQLFRILENKPWNQVGARNLGMHVVPSGWVLMTDIDHVLPPSSAEAFSDLSKSRCKRRYYIPSRELPDGTPHKRHPNSYFMTKELYWDIGGGDESTSGYYGCDCLFRKRAAHYAVREEIDIPLVVYGRSDIEDASTTDWGRKNSPWHSSNNKRISELKKMKFPPRPENPLRFTWERQI